MVLHEGDVCRRALKLCRRIAVFCIHAVTVRFHRLGCLESVGLVVSQLEKSIDAHIAKDSSGEIEHEKSKHILPEVEICKTWGEIHREHRSSRQRKRDKSRVFENKCVAKIRVF